MAQDSRSGHPSPALCGSLAALDLRRRDLRIEADSDRPQPAPTPRPGELRPTQETAQEVEGYQGTEVGGGSVLRDRRARARLHEVAGQLAGDELELLVEVAEGLALGRSQYGALDIDSDARDFELEARQEERDLVVYTLAGIIGRRRRSRF